MDCIVHPYTDTGSVWGRNVTYDFIAQLTGPDTLEVNYNDGRGPAELTRCGVAQEGKSNG